MTSKKTITRDLFFLALFLSLLFGLFLGTRPLMTPDEGRYVEIPREMVESGDYLTPHLNYLKYFEKPALFYWMIAAGIKLFGMNEWALRGIVGVMSLLGCLMVYIAGLRLYDRRTGILASLILATCALYFTMARFIITDMPVTIWITASLLLFILGTQTATASNKRFYFWGMYACAALAVMTKGLIGVVIPGMIIFIWLCIAREWKQFKTFCLPTGTLLFLLIAAPWHILVQLQNPEFFQFYFIDQHFLRYFTDYAGRQQAVWFFPSSTLGGFFPWVCFLLVFAVACFRKSNITGWIKLATHRSVIHRSSTQAHHIATHGSTHQILDNLENNKLQPSTSHPSVEIQQAKTTLFFMLWAILLFIFFSKSESQLLSYALPIMPPLAILTARYFSLHWGGTSSRAIQIGFLLVAVLGILMSAGGLIALHMKFIPSVTLAYVTLAVLFSGTIISAVLYRYRNLRWGISALILTAGATFILGDVMYPRVDTRSTKPLAAILLESHLKPDSEVATYHDYYQDLPVYLKRRITVVEYMGELTFGARHQDTSAWMIDEKTFWRRWHDKPGMFMITGKEDYAVLKKQHSAPMYLLGETPQAVLLTNSR